MSTTDVVSPPPNQAPSLSSPPAKQVRPIASVTIVFAGDSGDGMQLAGTQFTDTSALVGNDISTLPDFPAEIRAPAGTLAGVSGFQIHFSSTDIFTPGDSVDVLVAMNPAALKTNMKNVKDGGLIIVNEDSFEATDLKKAHYAMNPLEDGSLQHWRVVKVPINKLTEGAAKETGLGAKEIDRCKNMFALGLVYWLYSRPLEPTLNFINVKFAKKNPAVAMANTLALKAGYHFGETAELFNEQYHVPKAQLAPGTYRKITGNEAVAIANASTVAAKQSLGDAGAITASGHSLFRPYIACSRSACSVFVGSPVLGPPRWTSTMTTGSSTITASPIASALSATPGPLVPVQPSAPPKLAPIAAPIAAISSSAWNVITPKFLCADSSCRMSLAGVIGYEQ